MPIQHVILLFTLFFSPIIHAEALENLNSAEVKQKISTGALVIDIRTEKEWQKTGLIPGSHPLSFFDANGKSNPEKWVNDLNALKSSANQEVILVCHSGNRSGRVGTYLSQQLKMSHISHLSSGISSWLREKNSTIAACSSLKNC